MKGGKSLSEGEGAPWGRGAVLGGWGRWRSMKRVLVGVRKAEMWVEANWSIRLRYLYSFVNGSASVAAFRATAVRGERSWNAHLIVRPLHLVHEVQTAMDDERVHLARFLTEACDAIAALFGGAEFELEERLVVDVYYAEVV